MTDLGGTVHAVAGSGAAGFQDGPLAEAMFHNPQGMALDPSGTLYVADASNHVIRAVDLERQTVSTVAGTGEQAQRARRGGPAHETALSSPADLALRDAQLFIAMAGLHQVWMLDLARDHVSVWAGTGHEGIRDGARESAWLAQPMGLALDGDRLYVSCAETQAVRAIDLSSEEVTTLVGRGLFDFGDEDGGPHALLQHNQAVAAGDGAVWVADTYNNKVKRIDPGRDRVETALGSGAGGCLDGPGTTARLNEPSGLSLLDRTLFIADTNNHAVRVAAVDELHVRTLEITGLDG
jgi:DNA-binding beta-propeller fold protein YncE